MSDEEQPKDERAEKREYEKGVMVRTFTLQEGPIALALIEKLADARFIEPINETDMQRADRFMWWREGRNDLIREIKAILKSKENAQ